MARGSGTRKRQRTKSSDSSDSVEEPVAAANMAEPASAAATSTATSRKKHRNISSKEVAFNERYEPEKNSNQDILGAYPYNLPNHSSKRTYRRTAEEVEVSGIRPFPCTRDC